MTLDGYYGPQNVAVSMAARRGYINDVGLYVAAATPLSPSARAVCGPAQIGALEVSMHEERLIAAVFTVNRVAGQGVHSAFAP